MASSISLAILMASMALSWLKVCPWSASCLMSIQSARLSTCVAASPSVSTQRVLRAMSGQWWPLSLYPLLSTRALAAWNMQL